MNTKGSFRIFLQPIMTDARMHVFGTSPCLNLDLGPFFYPVNVFTRATGDAGTIAVNFKKN